MHELGESSPWREVVDEYTGGSDAFHERHYNEFVSFLPYVQQFLYGEGRARRSGIGQEDDPARPRGAGAVPAPPRQAGWRCAPTTGHLPA